MRKLQRRAQLLFSVCRNGKIAQLSLTQRGALDPQRIQSRRQSAKKIRAIFAAGGLLLFSCALVAQMKGGTAHGVRVQIRQSPGQRTASGLRAQSRRRAQQQSAQQ